MYAWRGYVIDPDTESTVMKSLTCSSIRLAETLHVTIIYDETAPDGLLRRSGGAGRHHYMGRCEADDCCLEKPVT